MKKALNKTGRHIVYSCEWPMYERAHGGTVLNVLQESTQNALYFKPLISAQPDAYFRNMQRISSTDRYLRQLGKCDWDDRLFWR